MSGRRTALVVVGLALAMAGCSDGSEDPAATATVTETVTTLPEAPTTLTPSPSTTPSAPSASATAPGDADVPRTYDDALEHFDTFGSEPVDVTRFELPSGNIYCLVQHDVIPPGCEVGEGAIRDEGVCAGSPSAFVGRVEFQRRRATPVCNTDTIREPGAAVLRYGEAARVPGGDVMCLSEEIGVTCISMSRTEGFFLRSGEYVIFNAG